MRTNSVLAAIAVTAFVVFLVLSFGVSWPVHAMPPASPADACSLLTDDQVKAVLGVAVGVGQHIVPNNSSLCGGEQPGQSGASRKRVLVSIYVPLGKLSPIDRFNAAKTPVNGITKTPVSGVGIADQVNWGVTVRWQQGDEIREAHTPHSGT